MKKRFVKVLSLLLCVLIAVGTVTISKRPEAEAATNEYTTTLTSVSEAPEGQEQTNILHMDRTVTESSPDMGQQGETVSVVIPDTVTTLGDDAFFGHYIKRFIIPASVKSMNVGVIRSCAFMLMKKMYYS